MGAFWSSKKKPTPAAMSSSAPPWSELPPEPAALILRHLSCDADRFCFAFVCRQWQHVARQFWSGWSILPPDLVVLVLRRLSSDSDRARLASMCRRWRIAAAALYSRWSSVSLPPEILDLVLRRLDSHIDRVSFASVCRRWRHVARQYSAPLPPALPWLMFPHGVYYQSLPDGDVRFLCHREQDDLCYGCFDHNWLLFKEIGSNRRYLENPLTRATIELPGHCNEPVFLFSNGTFQTPSNLTSANLNINKVIVCSADLIAAIVKYDYHNVVVCCRPGMLSWSTGMSKLTDVYRYQDMAFYNGMVYAVANGGDLSSHEVSKDINTSEPRVSRITQVMAAPPPLDGYYQSFMESNKCYLVISCANKLLLVRWFLPCTIDKPDNKLMLKVFEADFKASKWIEVERLDDQVLFVNSNCSKAISTASTHHQYLKDNRIYAIDDDIVFWHYWQGRDSCACMYDMSSKTIHPISLGGCMSSRSEAAWFFP